MSDRASEQSKSQEVMEQQSDNLSHALAGAGGGLLSMALTYPLITLSTRAQVEKQKAKTSTFDSVKRIVDREGIAGLYAGMESALFGITTTNFVYYYWYEFSRAFFQRTTNKTNLTTFESMAAGALAGSATVFLTNPIWVVNTRMTARQEAAEDDNAEKGEAGTKSSPPTTFGTLMKIIREDGFMRLFAGVLPALVLVANPIIQYTVFERLKQFMEKRKGKSVGAVDSFVMGAMGKLVATTVTYPYITVKSRAHVATGSGQKEGMIASLRRTVKEEGVAGLYGGIAPKLTQSVIQAAFLFAFKDLLYDMTVKARKKVVQKV